MDSPIVQSAPRPQPLKLQTPLSATFPSEIQSPAMAMSPSLVKREEAEKTPISPPAAYLNFLSKMSTATPPQSASLDGRPTLTSHPSVESVASTGTTVSTSSFASSVDSLASDKTETTQQSEAQPTNAAAAESISGINIENVTIPSSSRTRSVSSHEPTAKGKGFVKPSVRPVTIPKSPFSPGPESARSLRRLHIPQSPYSPRMSSPSMTSPMIASPLSAGCLVSPYAQTYSPRDRDFGTGVVGMRQTITRYISVPNKKAPVMEPVPANKERKIEQAT